MSDNTRLEIITLGDELLLGIRENTHLTYFGKQFTRYGHSIQRNIVIRDDPDHIARYFRDAMDNSDIVITTGGLGPTTDDITRETVAQVLELNLIHDDETEKAIRARFKSMGRGVTENNLRQAKKPDGAEIITNHHGTAPGLWLQHGGKIIIMLPGPPHELYPMFENQVLPRLQSENVIAESESYLQLRTIGVGESLLETNLQPVFDRYADQLLVSYCAHSGLVDLRLSPINDSLSWKEIKAIGDECKGLLGDDFICYGDESLARLVFNQLRSLNKTLALAESCTGGLLANAFTDIPGSSKVFVGGVVCYTNDAKVQLLDLPDAIIQQHGAVSAECAVAMATGAAERLSADYALSVTGFAGPNGGNRENPVGTIYLGYHSPVGVWSNKLVFSGNRLMIKSRAVSAALDWMRRKLKKYETEDLLVSMSS